MGYVTVGKSDAVPDGELALVDANGAPVTVANVDGQFYAIDDTCTHKQCSLADGELEGASVVCACHAGQFDLATGEVLAGPPPAPVSSYQVRVEGDDLQVEI